MGSSYYVPRSVKGETRILYIFTIKSFAVTLAFGLVGFGIIWIIGTFTNVGIISKLIVTGIFAAIGYMLASLKIPDAPIMGPLRKAGGENVGSMLVRVLFFNRKKKIYLYNYKREVNKGGENNGK